MKREYPWWTRLLNRRLQIGLDFVALAVVLVLAYLLRFEFVLSPIESQNVVTQLPLVLLIQLAATYSWGVYNVIWRYVGLRDIRRFVAAVATSLVPLLALRFFLPAPLHHLRVPVSIILIDAVLALGALTGMRMLRRLVFERYEHESQTAGAQARPPKPVLLVGAGRAGALAMREIQGRGDIGLDVKGFVDDDPGKQGSSIHDVPVLGTTEDLPRLVAELEIDHVVLTIASAARREIVRIVEICERIPIKVRVVPGLYEILEGKVDVKEIRDVEIEDLLGREPVTLDEAGLRGLLTGKRVLVTGAGGSIGSELARQITRFEPSRLVLVDRCEFALYGIQESLAPRWPAERTAALIADVCDEARMREVFSAERPHVVLHAAAHKHVPLMESNVGEAVKNNVLGTHRTAELAGQHGVETFILVSTDKAVNPTSVMGATKRAAELVVQTLDGRYGTRFLAVRFGNVLGSTGSVVPKFREQIAKGGPVTVTHPEMRRYFMTIPEAAQLVLQAAALGKGGEIFVLDMGEPIKIVDLARDMIRLSGFRPEDDIQIVFTGLRPGEKLFEELGTSEENVIRTRHEKVLVGRIPRIAPERVTANLEQLREQVANADEEGLRLVLQELIPEASLGGVENGAGVALQERG